MKHLTIDVEAAASDSLSVPTRRKQPVPQRRVTITDVAKKCGVTAATVSRVLNGKKQFSASEAVRQKILEAAASMGYVPDLAARNLNRRETHIIGLFASPRTRVAEGINESLIEGVAEVLHAAGFDLFFELSAANRQNEALPFWRFDGAILMQSPKPETVAALDRRRVPYVCVNEQIGDPVAAVLADDPMGTRRAVEHLAQLGHKVVGYANARATYLHHHSAPERYDTLLAVARELGMRVARGHELPFSSARDFLQKAVRDEGATAVISYDHQIAVSIVGTAHAMGLRIPHDFSLICFNDVFPVAMLPTPLTAVTVSGREMGRIGADLLLNQLGGGEERPSQVIRVAEDLIVRASTAPPKA